MADVSILNVNNTDYNIRDDVARSSIPSPADVNPLMDGTADVGTSTDYAREDHVHPTDTSRQATLVSGTNIKTVNSTSLLGSGNVAVQPTLVSGTNIKTINGNSILGNGDLTISDSDQKVTQTNTATTTNAAYRIILSQNANDTTETNGVRKTSNFLYNPSQASLYIGSPSAEHLTLGKTAITFDTGSAVTSFGHTQVDAWESHITNGNHNLTAATTQAVYPIKIDSRGHISAYGSAVTNIVQTTATQTLTNKTLTAPSLSNPVVGGNLKFDSDGTSDSSMRLIHRSIAANGTLTYTRASGATYIVFICAASATNSGLYLVHGSNVKTISASSMTTITTGSTTGLTIKCTSAAQIYMFRLYHT